MGAANVNIIQRTFAEEVEYSYQRANVRGGTPRRTAH